MTTRLYYDDPTLRAFDATVVRVEPRETSVAVWLDRTAFYPTSGGQPHDVGVLGPAAVSGVEEDESGDVVHVVGADAALAVGARVQGQIEWARRFDHMQQHTGQHVLSAVLEHAFEARTVGFHLGADMSTLDLDRELTPAQLARAEREANGVVWEDRPVSIRYATDEEARLLPLRKESVRTGTLRLIDIEGVDLSACGGTHVARTGAIGQVVLQGWERFRGGQRLEFVCGGRALSRHQLLRDVAAASIRLVSVLPADLPAAIERLQGELKEQKRTLAAMQLELASHEAAALVAGAESLPAGRVVLRVVDGDAARLKALASAAARIPDLLVVLVSGSPPALAIAARGPESTVSCGDLIGALARQFGGRGGGKPDLAQCGGLQAAPTEVLAAARMLLAQG